MSVRVTKTNGIFSSVILDEEDVRKILRSIDELIDYMQENDMEKWKSFQTNNPSLMLLMSEY